MLGYRDAQFLDITGPLEVFARTSRWVRDKGLHSTDAASAIALAGFVG
jgi:hypothetical protein